LNWLNGTTSTSTSAPWTGLPSHDTCARIVIVWDERPTTPGLIDCPSTSSRSGGATFAIWIGALPAQPLGAAGAARTTAVGTEVAWAEPSLFRAVTRERIVLPTSTRLSKYVLSVAPPIVEQLPPFSSQRRHW
jgi:hypothetical protein